MPGSAERPPGRVGGPRQPRSGTWIADPSLEEEDKNVLDVTCAAREALHEMILHSAPEQPYPGDLGFRVVALESLEEKSVLGLALDKARPGDQVVRHDQRTVLLLDAIVATVFDGRTLDLVETIRGEQLSIR
jgi:hypothetical protein